MVIADAALADYDHAQAERAGQGQRGHDAPAVALRRYQRLLEQSRDGTRVPLLSRLAEARWRLHLGLACAKNALKYGPAAREAAGLSLLQMARETWALCVRDRCRPGSYYQFRLYLSERRHAAERFLHQIEAQRMFEHVNDGPDVAVLDDKLKFAAACAARGLPHVETVAYFDRDRPAEAISPEPSALPRRDLFVKPTDMRCGTGVQCWRYDAADGSYEHEGMRLTARRFIDHVRRLSEHGVPAPLWKRIRAWIPRLGYKGERYTQQARPYIVQKRLENHDSVARFTNGSVCTVRVVTAKAVGGEPQLIAAALRMPTGDSPVDNFAAGGLASPIDPATGRLGRAVPKDPRRPSVDAHPDSGETITGEVVAFWEEARALGLRAHRLFPHVATVGWDVAITDEGPKLIEANPGWCVEVIQMAHGSPLGDTPLPELLLSHARPPRALA